MADPRTRIPPAAAKALRGLTPELRLAGAAAAALLFTMILPWYEKSYFATSGDRPVAVSDNLNAIQVFSFVEAAVLLVAAGVLYLVWARSQDKGFHLPGGDGTVIMGAGGWALLLLVWRLFDKPDVDDPGATVGIAWGLFAALLAAGAADRGGGAGAGGAPARAAEPGGGRRRLGAPAARGAARRARVAQPAGADDGQRGAERRARLGGRAARGAGPGFRAAAGAAGARAQRRVARQRPPVLSLRRDERQPRIEGGTNCRGGTRGDFASDTDGLAPG